MVELVVEKKINPVMDLCIAYGLFQIVTKNKTKGTKATLKNYPSAYVIHYDDFDIDEAYLNPVDLDWLNFGKFLSLNNKKKLIITLFGSDDEESQLLKDNALHGILTYYATPVQDRDVSVMPPHCTKKHWTGIIGTWYGGKGHRTSGSATTGYRAYMFERWLSELGFIHAVSYTAVNEKKDYLMWVGIPSELGTQDVRLFHDAKYNSETEKKERIQYMTPHSVEIGLASTHLLVQKLVTIHNIAEEYDGALFMRGWFNGNTGSVDRVDTLAFYPCRESTINLLQSHLQIEPRDKKVAFQHALSTWLISQTQDAFYETINILAQDDRRVDPEESEDYMAMAGLTELHTNLGVVRLGKRLNELVYNKRGYTLTLDLMDVHTKQDLMSAITQLSIEYEKLYKNHYAMWDTGDYHAFLEAVDNPNFNAKDIASAVLLQSKTRPEKETDK